MSDRKTGIFRRCWADDRRLCHASALFGTLATMGLALACDPFSAAWSAGPGCAGRLWARSPDRSRGRGPPRGGGARRWNGTPLRGRRWTAAASPRFKAARLWRWWRRPCAYRAGSVRPGAGAGVFARLVRPDRQLRGRGSAGGVAPVRVAALQTLVSAALDVGAAFRDRPQQPSHETVKGNKP